MNLEKFLELIKRYKYQSINVQPLYFEETIKEEDFEGAGAKNCTHKKSKIIAVYNAKLKQVYSRNRVISPEILMSGYDHVTEYSVEPIDAKKPVMILVESKYSNIDGTVSRKGPTLYVSYKHKEEIVRMIKNIKNIYNIQLRSHIGTDSYHTETVISLKQKRTLLPNEQSGRCHNSYFLEPGKYIIVEGSGYFDDEKPEIAIRGLEVKNPEKAEWRQSGFIVVPISDIKKSNVPLVNAMLKLQEAINEAINEAVNEASIPVVPVVKFSDKEIKALAELCFESVIYL